MGLAGLDARLVLEPGPKFQPDRAPRQAVYMREAAALGDVGV